MKKEKHVEGHSGGAWTEASHAKLYPKNFNRGLAEFIADTIAPRDFLEFGSGMGTMANAIAERIPLGDSYCIEPQIAATLRTDRGLHQLNIDIFEEPAPGVLNRKFDLILSIEVAEHIPRDRHEALFDFLAARAGNHIVFSAARPGQGGHGHVAERPENEWRAEFEQRDFVFDDDLTTRARNRCDEKNINHRRNVMVFKAPRIYDELDALERRAAPHLRDILSVVQANNPKQFLDGNLFYVNMNGAIGGMPEDSLRPKRLNLLQRSAMASNILEIGFNAGHSALLMLLANPTSKLTIIDLLDRSYARACFEYLSSVFPGRLTLLEGDSRKILRKLTAESFDLVHYDGGKHRTIRADLEGTRELVRDDHVLVIDDTQNEALDSVVEEFAKAGQLSLGAYAEDSRRTFSRRWKHKLARFAPRPDLTQRLLKRVRQIYESTSFPSVYIAKKTDALPPGFPKAESLVSIMRDVEEKELSGAFVEIGVAAGHSSVIAALAKSGFIPRNFYLFDTFEGFPELPNEMDHKGKSIRDYDLQRYRENDCEIDTVRARVLATGIDPARLFLIKGDAVQTVGRADTGPIAVLRLDADLFAPTMACLEAFYDKLQPNGWLIVDDYGHWQGCRDAVDQFFQKRGTTFDGKATDYTCYVARKTA